MIRKFLFPLVSLLLLVPMVGWSVDKDCFPPEMIPDNLFPIVKIETSMGDIEVELNRMRAPISSNNFLRYVLEGEYDGTIFHRVMPGFVVQGAVTARKSKRKPCMRISSMNPATVCRIHPARSQWRAMMTRIPLPGSFFSI